MWEQDVREAEGEWLCALRSDPAYATARHCYAMGGLVPQRRFDEALAVIREAERLDLLSLPIVSDTAFVPWARRYDQAVEQCRKALSLNPSFYRAHILLGRITRQATDIGIVREASGEFTGLAGARVHEQGRLVGFSNGATSWEGVIRVMTSSAHQ